jgi:hypothetical protein
LSPLLWLRGLDVRILLIGCVIPGLLPFYPLPHLFEKLAMLYAGRLVVPIDCLDLLMHGFFPLMLMLKLVFGLKKS